MSIKQLLGSISKSITNSQDDFIRAFVAVNIPEPAANELDQYLGSLKPLAKLRWVSKAQFHITLRFLGEQKRETIEFVKDALMPLHFIPFDAELSYAGAFPNLKYPRVLWLSGNRGVQELTTLAEKVNEAIDSVGLPSEKREFKPHLTLARTDGKPLPPALLKKLENPPTISWRCESFNLMRSRLTQKGAIYSAIPLSDSIRMH
ncbi:MAG: RNA 2',3'-cyclic phosphodiesterase [Desulfovibrio sp.]|nr:RNA 2',3'-cyclic phosphodiesterase [Desulfovibrio sp.]